MKNLARETALTGGLVIWEECARDGAQAKTLLSAEQRIRIAKLTGELFGSHGPNHVIFAAGFPSIANEEFEIVRRLAAEVDNCSLATHGRATEADIQLGIRALDGAENGHVTFFVPVSAQFAHALGLGDLEAVRRLALDRLAFAVDASDGVAVDIAFADASRADPGFAADLAQELTAAGASIIKLCDSAGVWYPRQSKRFLEEVVDRTRGNAVLGVHTHNDFGFALANNLNAVELGIRITASSWLGVGERNGLASTEQMIFAFSQDSGTLSERLGYLADFWLTRPRLTGLIPIARLVSEKLGVPLKVTDPVVSTGLNKISTGTPFRASGVIQAFDPATELGLPREIVLTQLANTGLIAAVASELGFDDLTERELALLLKWVKTEAYRTGRAIIPKTMLRDQMTRTTEIRAAESRAAERTLELARSPRVPRQRGSG